MGVWEDGIYYEDVSNNPNDSKKGIGKGMKKGTIKTKKEITRYGVYRFLEFLTGKKHNTIKIWFYRNRKNPMSREDVTEFIKKTSKLI